jgi:hypothetical protein
MNLNHITDWICQSFKDSQGRKLTYKQWKQSNRSAYVIAHKKGWLEDIKQYLPEPPVWWSREKVIQSIYTTDGQLIPYGTWAKQRGAYDFAVKNGLLDEIHALYGRVKIRWTKRLCVVDARKYSTPTDWRIRSWGAYSTAKKNGWLDVCMKHMKRKRRNYWTKELLLLETMKFNTFPEWYASVSYQTATRLGLTSEFKELMGWQHFKRGRKKISL